MRGSHPKTPAVRVALRGTVCTALVALLLAAGSAPFAPARAVTPPDDPTRELPLLLRKLDKTHRILYVTAHPDDEDSALLARLAFGDGAETALLTLTRGEGGQNEIGTELSHALGVLRSRELQAAGRYLGVRQLFSRAFEFGYSFSVEETFEKWHKPSIVRDVVRVIREFQPDVILTMPPEGPGGGQHHQACARIAAEAMTIAASEDWPELGAPHRTSRLFRDVWEPDAVVNLCEISVSAYDPLLGGTYAAFGAASRAQHKCQGMARLTDPLEPRMSRWEMLFDVEGSPHAVGHFLEGLRDPLLGDGDDPTDVGETVFHLAAAIRDAYQPERPSAIVPALLDLWRRLAKPTDVPLRWQTLKDRVARALYLASGLQVAARADRRSVAPGQTLSIEIQATNSGPFPVEVTFGLTGGGMEGVFEVIASHPRSSLAPGEMLERRFDLRIDTGADATICRPVPEHGDRVGDADAARFHTDPLWSAFGLQVIVRIDGEVVPVPPVPIDHEGIDPRFPTVVRSDPQIVPDPAIRPRDPVLPFPIAPGRDAGLEIELLVSSLEPGTVDVELSAPPGWVLSPGKHEIRIEEPGEDYAASFTLRPSADGVASSAGPFDVTARATHRERDRTSTEGYQTIEYPHIRPGALLHDAVVRVVPFEYRPPGGLRAGYVEGAGDRVAEAMERIGVTPELLDDEDLLEGALDDFDVIVTGVRAYKVRDDLKAAHRLLLDWVRNGGTLLVQYNKLEFNDGRDDSSPFAPFPGTLVGHRRVTVEESPVVIRNPEHPVFNRPNVITAADWRGWVQERGLYFLDFEDARYDDLLEMEDPWPFNAGPQGGSLVHARVGKGRWVYVGIGLFRQLPAAVPGAYRLLANLLALGNG